MLAANNNYNSDVLVIAQAFRAARDEDTREVLNVMAAKKTPSSLNDLKFYMVSASWMVKAWPMLSAHPGAPLPNGDNNGMNDDKWREKIGIIQNGELLSWDRTVSSSDEEGGENENGKAPKLMKQQKPTESCPLRSGLKHGEDYFLLGSRVWFLVREKFGSDEIELGQPVVFHEAGDSTLAVAIHQQPQNGNNIGKSPTQYIPIPAAGHFPYHILIRDLEGDSDESFLPQGRPAQQPALQQDAKKPSDVVSDDGDNDLPPAASDEPVDMVLGGESDSRIAAAEPAPQNNVLLLPPSASASLPNNNGSLYPDMECADADDDDVKVGPVASGTAITALAASAPSYKRYGSGLGNLGNSCYMNSTIQCLAHTAPLRRYFLSGEYEKDLNRDNPLGTGGDLATQFAQLLAEMWGTGAPADRRRVFPKVEAHTSYVSSSVSSAVYPRSFKSTLGKHAEQFMGYDQHDSQELATYLLDALHEDTNRVSKKPYIEKPEQGEDEPDEVAAKKAWELHLKREDSRVLENFMGQIKSRVQCCKEGCGRSSTTFDPFMFLSVPIPGSTERTMRVTFWPLDANERKKSLSVTLSRAATVGKLVTKVAEQLMKLGYSSNGRPFNLEELSPCDVWSHDVYTWYKMDEEIDKIRETDETVIYQMLPIAEIRMLEENEAAGSVTAENEAIAASLESSSRASRYQVDMATNMQLNRPEEWKTALENYLLMPNTQVMKILNERRGTIADRYELYQKIDNFINTCIQETDKASNKRAREEEDEDENPAQQDQLSPTDNDSVTVSADEEDVPALLKACEMSSTFTNVKTRFDIAILESCATKLKRWILQSVKSSQKKIKDGCRIQVNSRRSCASGSSSYSTSTEKSFVNPIVLRIPATMTVYGLREELAKRLVRSLRLHQAAAQPQEVEAASVDANADDQVSTESNVIPMENDSDRGDDENLSGVETMTVSSETQGPVGDPALQILRQIPLAYKKKSVTYGPNKSTKRLGSLDPESTFDDSPPISLASPTDDEENQLVAELVGDQGCVYLDWPAQLCDRYFDEAEFDLSDELKDPDEEKAIAARNRKGNRPTTILDCVEKYCQREQLEESEMWYCNRCKEHVRAWKQFHLYRAPPVLIIHLKRFQYSASTHRRDKINTFIDFPLENLDLSEVAMHWDEGEEPIYDCYAVSNHYGGLGGGHYTAYALNDDGVWCYYDDTRITENVNPKEVVTDAAYCVYYRRKDVSFGGEYSLEALQPPAIVADHFDKKEDETRSEASSTGAAQGDDMDVDAHSQASSKTDSSPMDSHDDMGGGSEGYSRGFCAVEGLPSQ